MSKMFYMFPKWTFSVLLLTVVILTRCVLVSDGQQRDPKCQSGIRKNGACCPRQCGLCGGSECFKRSVELGTRCCSVGILRSAPLCRFSGPPCKYDMGDDKPFERSVLSSVNGRWRIAPVRMGSLQRRHEACAVMVDGLVVLLGGRGVGRSVDIYNPRSKTWWQGASAGANIEIHHCQCVAIGSSVWIVSSWRGAFPFEKNNNRIFIYNVRRNSWGFRPGMGRNRNRGSAAAVRRGDWIYVVGGNRGGHGSHATALPWMDAYNWRTWTWTTVGTFPDIPDGGRDHFGGGLVNDELCIAGGRDSGTERFFYAVRRTTFCYNFVTRRWSQRADMIPGRAAAMTGTACDGRLVIAGGEGAGMAFSRVDVFDGYRWFQGPSLKDSRHGSGLAVASCDCGHMFIPSGSGRLGGSPELLTTEQYIPFGAPASC